MPKFNGHASWNAWNVALWINNDEPLYRRAYELSRTMTRNEAARQLLRELPKRTPDGAPYTFTTVRAALRDIL